MGRSTLVPEDGSVVPGANSLCSGPAAAAYHLGRGDLTHLLTINSSAITFTAATRALSGAAALFSGVPAGGALVRVEGAGVAGNSGWAYALGPTGGGAGLPVEWLAVADEGPGAAVSVHVYEQGGWWAALEQLEGSLIAATRHLVGLGLAWVGLRAVEGQGLPWPRELAYVLAETSRRGFGDLLPEDEVPGEVSEAVAALSRWHLDRALDAPLDPRDRALIEKEIAGAVRKKWESDSAAGPWPAVRGYPEVAALLVGLHDPGGLAVGPFVRTRVA